MRFILGRHKLSIASALLATSLTHATEPDQSALTAPKDWTHLAGRFQILENRDSRGFSYHPYPEWFTVEQSPNGKNIIILAANIEQSNAKSLSDPDPKKLGVSVFAAMLSTDWSNHFGFDNGTIKTTLGALAPEEIAAGQGMMWFSTFPNGHTSLYGGAANINATEIGQSIGATVLLAPTANDTFRLSAIQRDPEGLFKIYGLKGNAVPFSNLGDAGTKSPGVFADYTHKAIFNDGAVGRIGLTAGQLGAGEINEAKERRAAIFADYASNQDFSKGDIGLRTAAEIVTFSNFRGQKGADYTLATLYTEGIVRLSNAWEAYTAITGDLEDWKDFSPSTEGGLSYKPDEAWRLSASAGIRDNAGGERSTQTQFAIHYSY